MDVIRLNPKEERRLLRGHRWVFRSECAKVPELADGAVVDVLSDRGVFTGRGFYQAEGGIAVRLMANHQTAVDAAFFQKRIEDARVFRERCFPGETVYRWVFGESDGLPGLVADRYGAVVVVETPCAFYLGQVETLAKAFLAHAGVAGVRVTIRGQVFRFGDVPETVSCRMDGITFLVDIEGGQKTGLFLDQRMNAQAFRVFARGGEVFDGHCYAGLWSLHAAQAGALKVTGVDSSAPAIERAQANAVENGVGDRCSFLCADMMEALAGNATYDVVLLDPPALAKARSQAAKAMTLLQSMNRRALEVVRPGGMLITSTCSHFVDREGFLETLKRAAASVRRTIWVVDVRGASPDHPVLLSMPETAYLTCITLRVM